MPTQMIKSYETPDSFEGVHANAGCNVRTVVTGTVTRHSGAFPGGTALFRERSWVAHPLNRATARNATLMHIKFIQPKSGSWVQEKNGSHR
jgi:hypothetical protein